MHVTKERLLAYLDGEVSADERTELQSHLAACERCAVRLGEVSRGAERGAQALRLLDAPPPT
ncbi:MAG: anti-sigma factor family protein, partial [Gemmatimonadota bacterium]